MILQFRLRSAILIAVALTVTGAGFSLIYPNATNYLFLPGMMIVYFVSGGVHGYSSGVYLPGLLGWYILGGLVNVFIYSAIAFAVLRYLSRRKDTDSL